MHVKFCMGISVDWSFPRIQFILQLDHQNLISYPILFSKPFPTGFTEKRPVIFMYEVYDPKLVSTIAAHSNLLAFPLYSSDYAYGYLVCETLESEISRPSIR